VLISLIAEFIARIFVFQGFAQRN